MRPAARLVFGRVRSCRLLGSATSVCLTSEYFRDEINYMNFHLPGTSATIAPGVAGDGVQIRSLFDWWERRRWAGEGADPVAPGVLPANLRMDDRMGKDRCYPLSQQELETNPNLD